VSAANCTFRRIGSAAATAKKIIIALDDLAQPDLNVTQGAPVDSYRVVAVSDDGVHRSCVVRRGRFEAEPTTPLASIARLLETILPVVLPTRLA
jgi:hypothetical protein